LKTDGLLQYFSYLLDVRFVNPKNSSKQITILNAATTIALRYVLLEHFLFLQQEFSKWEVEIGFPFAGSQTKKFSQRCPRSRS
jgi:hypothetical protein